MKTDIRVICKIKLLNMMKRYEKLIYKQVIESLLACLTKDITESTIYTSHIPSSQAYFYNVLASSLLGDQGRF
jgi:hypothetical protein